MTAETYTFPVLFTKSILKVDLVETTQYWTNVLIEGQAFFHQYLHALGSSEIGKSFKVRRLAHELVNPPVLALLLSVGRLVQLYFTKHKIDPRVDILVEHVR